MKMIQLTTILILFSVLSLPRAPIVYALDMRAGHQTFERSKQKLLAQARAEKELAQKQATDQAREILKDKVKLKNVITDLKKQINDLTADNKKIKDHVNLLKLEEGRLQKSLKESAAVSREFKGVVRSNAKDLKSLIIQSLKSGLEPGNEKFLEPIILQQKFPSMDDVRRIADQLFAQITASGQVTLTIGPLVDRKGRERQAQLLLLGNFTGIYNLEDEIGFLLYSDASQRYFALSRLPSARIKDNISSYLSGNTANVFIDVSKGGAIRQLAHQMSLAEQVPKGGAIVWPILVILGVAVLILMERFIFFSRRRINAEKLMIILRQKVTANDWDGCKSILESKKKKLIPKVLLTALALKDRTRPEMENALQEAILGEIPGIERFLSTLGMLAAIAPLLGLLGTVTGMINTFHVITYYGTGDPRMMSGGISEALVTTMLGLSVAIPIMLCHTLLSRRVETQISRMEEKSVAFVNMVFKTSAVRH